MFNQHRDGFEAGAIIIFINLFVFVELINFCLEGKLKLFILIYTTFHINYDIHII